MTDVIGRTLRLTLIFLSLSGASHAQDKVLAGQANGPQVPIRHEPYATGKVLSVERHGDRFAVDVSIGAEDGIRVGRDTCVYIGPNLKLQMPRGNPADYNSTGQVVGVGDGRGTCNIGPELFSKQKQIGTPKVGDPVAIRRWHRPETFVVAKHVVIHDGRIYDWNSIPDRLAELNETGMILPGIRYTQAMREEMNHRNVVLVNWCRRATGRAYYSIGHVHPRHAEYYDSLVPDDRTLRDALKRKVGMVEFNGKRVAKAEIFVCTRDKAFTRNVYLEYGRLRNAWEEPSRTLSELNGKFDVFPDSETFQVLVFHELGFAAVSSDEWPKNPVIELEPWAQISGKFTDDEFDEAAYFVTRLQLEGQARIHLNVGNTPLRADRSFHNPWIPPGKVTVTRAVESPHGGATHIRQDSFELEPGESRDVTIGPMDDEGRMKAIEYLKRRAQDR